MAEPVSYIVEIDELGNPSIKYSDGTPYNVNIADYSAEVLKQLAPRKMSYTLANQIDGRYIGAVKGGEKFILPYSPQEIMEAVEVEEGIEYTIDDITAQLVRNTGASSFYETIRAAIISVDRDNNVVKKGEFIEFTPSRSVSADATFEDGESCVNCSVTVTVGGLEYGPYLFLYDKQNGGDSEDETNENVDLPEAD